MKTLLALAVSLLACGVSFSADIIAPDLAKTFVGKNAIVEGKVAEVAEHNGNVFINLDLKFPHQPFYGYVPSKASDHFENGFLQSLEGKTVQIKGKVELYKGRPEIVVTEQSQIKVVE